MESQPLAVTTTVRALRVLIVSNFAPVAEAPQRGRWVLDQAAAIAESGIDVDVFSFEAGKRNYPPAVREVRRRLRRGRFDLVHAHYGLAGWVAYLAGARPLVVTHHGTDVRHRVVGPLSRLLAYRTRLTAGVSQALFAPEDERPGLRWRAGRSAVLPCGPDLSRFKPLPRDLARRELGLDLEEPLLFFPANPNRPEKGFDRAQRLADATGTRLLTGGAIPPDEMPLWINAANAVLVTSDYEGFGLACLEALACEVPVLSTAVGIAPHALAGLEHCLAAPFELEQWRGFLAPLLTSEMAVPGGSDRASRFSSKLMADRVVHAYGDVLGENPNRGR